MSSHNEADRLILRRGEIVSKEFRIIDQVGEGTYSNVYSAINIYSQRNYVIKACRNKPNYNEAAEKEMRTLDTLSRLDPDHRHFVHYYGYIRYKDHYCLLFEKLGCSLYSAFEYRKFQPFKIDTVRDISFQILSSLDILHRHKMIHTDLKLENVLLCGNFIDENGCDIYTKRKATNCRLIDFGSLNSGSFWHHHLATTRYCRAPEITMGLRWSYECDIWSFGCLMLELAIGSIPFDSRDPVECLFLIQNIMNPFPSWMWKQCSKKDLTENVRHGLIQQSSFEKNKLNELLKKPSLKSILSFDSDFKDVILEIMNPNPVKRPTTSDLLEHPFFSRH